MVKEDLAVVHLAGHSTSFIENLITSTAQAGESEDEQFEHHSIDICDDHEKEPERIPLETSEFPLELIASKSQGDNVTMDADTSASVGNIAEAALIDGAAAMQDVILVTAVEEAESKDRNELEEKYSKAEHTVNSESSAEATITTTDSEESQFLTTVRHAEKKFAIMKKQMAERGITPAEYIPLPELKAEMQAMMEQQPQGGASYDEKRYEYLELCLRVNPEYIAEQEEEARRWYEEIKPFLLRMLGRDARVYSLECVRRFCSGIDLSRSVGAAGEEVCAVGAVGAFCE